MRGARRTAGWVGAVVLLGAVIWGFYLLLQRLVELGSEYAANRYILPVLTIALVVLSLALGGVLIRNLVRLVVDRKRGILGSRLRAKLVFFLLGFVLFPALMMVYGSAVVIKRTVEAIVKTPIEQVTSYSREIVDAWNDFLRRRCVLEADRIGNELERHRIDDRTALGLFLDGWRRRDDLDFVLLVRPGDEPLLELAPDLDISRDEADHLAEDAMTLVRAAEASGRPESRLDLLGRGLLVHAAAPIRAGPSGSVVGVVSVGLVHSHDVTFKMREITRQADAYRQFRLERRDLVRLYLMLILLILLVTVFLATWIGFYLGRRITEPIQEVAAAAREISAGNLGVRVHANTGDEVGVLVDAFNEMAAQLQESREVINRSNADLRRSNRALDERRRYIETLVANLSTAVISLDRDGRVTTSNPATERILGVRPGTGERLREHLGGDALRPLADLLDSHGGDEAVDFREQLVLPMARGSMTVAVQVAPLRGAQGERLGTLVMIEDLTDLMRAQRAAAWREVARRIAHEIKNPLTPIQLAAQRLRKKFAEGAPDLDAVLPQATDSIEREVAGLKRLVDEFSRFARMPEVVTQPSDVRRIVDSVTALYEGSPGVRFDVDVAPDVGEVRVDPEQLRRALINLVDNALAAIDGDGTVGIAASRTQGRRLLRIEVSDTGPGIRREDRDRLFVPYFSTKGSGTGLGLAIVHRVVSEHRGTIRVEDNRPHGARFVIELPV